MDEEIRAWAKEIEHYQEQIIRRLEMINDKIKKKMPKIYHQEGKNDCDCEECKIGWGN